MKLIVNIEKRYFFGILVGILVIAGIFAVYAVWPTDGSKTVWHSGNDVKVNIGGIDYSLQEAINSGFLSTIEIGSAYAENNTNTSIIKVIPLDSTPPLIQEGQQILSLDYHRLRQSFPCK